MKLVLDNAFPILTTFSLGAWLLAQPWPKWNTARIVIGAADVLYAVLLLVKNLSASA